MKVSQIIYKVDNLEEAVKSFTNSGFAVEYGKKKNPYNALIYFSSGPYLEILSNTGVPKVVTNLMKVVGYKQLASRIEFWDNQNEGFVGVALEKEAQNLKEEKIYLKEKKIKSFSMFSRRTDVYGRKLACKCLFPEHIDIPFMMTAFKTNPKPKEYIHPNGAKEICSVKFGCRREFIDIITDLCTDNVLKLFEGAGISDIMIKDSKGKKKNILSYL